jgi:hypothetical protein
MTSTSATTSTASADTLWTDAEIIEILTDAAKIDGQIAAVADRIRETGSPVPLRSNLGFWEEMRLDQRALMRRLLAA